MEYVKARMNLRLFDETTTQTTLLPDLSGDMKTYYVDRLLDVAEPNLVHAQFGDKYPIPQGRGKKIEWRVYEPLGKALTPLAEGVTPKGNDLKMSVLTGEVEQFGDWTRISDLLELTALDNNILQATKLHGAQAGRTIDTLDRDTIAGGTNVFYAPKIVGGVETPVLTRAALTVDCKITPDLLFRVAANLKTMLAEPFEGGYVGIVHPYIAYDLMRHPEWLNIAQYHPENYYKGEIGKLGNIRFVETSEAKIIKDASCPSDGGTGRMPVAATMILGQHAYGLTEVEGGGLEVIVKQRGYGEDPLNQRSSVGWKATHATTRLVEGYMVRIECIPSQWKMLDAN